MQDYKNVALKDWTLSDVKEAVMDGIEENLNKTLTEEEAYDVSYESSHLEERVVLSTEGRNITVQIIVREETF